jgi:pimeloyl-ACP methyl ester carboxylesterase
MKKFPGHVLCVADPTLELHDEMNLGWYIGTDEHDASEELSRFIRHFAEALGIPQSKIVIWGSSGGGFSALALASHIEKATAVAINAQTDIFAYELVRVVETVRRNCFGSKIEKQIKEQFGPRVNMGQAWRSNRSSRVILIQNKLDTHHYACHFRPFWESLGGTAEGGASADGRHYAWLYSDPRGHGSESVQMIPVILDLINHDSFTASTVVPTTRASKS